jgi:asparagine N-glycosylation enzyme membrane subunit Stt3
MKLSKELNILHLDGAAGLTVGLLMFFLQNWVSNLYSLPISTIHFLATANVCYGVYALSLALSSSRKPISISLLATANSLWMVVCVVVILLFVQTASLIGLVFISLEGLFVIILAIYEWKNKDTLSEASNA